MMERIQSERDLMKATYGSESVQTSPAMWSENKMGILDKQYGEESVDAVADSSDVQILTLEAGKASVNGKVLHRRTSQNSLTKSDKSSASLENGKVISKPEAILKTSASHNNSTLNGEKLSENSLPKSKPRVRIVEYNGNGLDRRESGDGGRSRTGEFLQTASSTKSGSTAVSSKSESKDDGKMIDVPPFVQLETLHPGMVFVSLNRKK